ncbi:MAG: hypothetical protein ACOWYE_03255 [Desulfatiglandales bacterium]
MDPIPVSRETMSGFADATGLSGAGNPPRRYLWTDAFAVCNFLELFRRTGEEHWRRTALSLVHQVHAVLGRHREDDSRTGWISGLGEEEGRRHPTAGGLRIGKKLNERKPGAAPGDREEWDRDGQYYHYLTKWMHALNRVSRFTRDPIYNVWARELAKAAHAGFVHGKESGPGGMYWKMSIDLSRSLVSSMGLHDPLDGLVTYKALKHTASEFPERPDGPLLDAEIGDMEELCKGRAWMTDDPLGLGGLLDAAYRIFQLIAADSFPETGLLTDLLESSLAGLHVLGGTSLMRLSAEHRLAFRELGMSIGLHAVERMREASARHREFPGDRRISLQVDRLARNVPLARVIEEFWLDPLNRASRSWLNHEDINGVMLTTSLIPDGYLEL